MEDQAIILPGDFKMTLEKIDQKADVIFVDPPYHETLVPKVLERIVETDRLQPWGIVVAEHVVDDVLPQEICGLELIKERKYGTILVSVYGYPEDEEDEE